LNNISRHIPDFSSIALCSTLILPLILSNTTALAANKSTQASPWYQIEVIIFSNLEQVGLASETWPDSSELKYTQLIALRHPDDAFLNSTSNQPPEFNLANMPTPYELLPSSQLQLVPILKKLQRSQSYQPLLHIAWRQPTADPKVSNPVYIFDGVEKSVINDLNGGQPQAVIQHSSADGNRFSAVNVGAYPYDSSQYGRLFPAAPADTLVGAAFQKLSGTLRLSVSRYLHLEVDLNYRIPVLKEEVITVEPDDGGFQGSGFTSSDFTNPDATNSGFSDLNRQLNAGQLIGNQEPQTYVQRRQALQNFHLYETRRLRSKEIHYYDHPLYGIITRVVPYELPKVEKDFDPDAQAFTTDAPSKPTP